MDMLSTIGNTPLVKLHEKVYAKFETLNPSGSIKDRIAKYIVENALERGDLKPGDTIIEATSGNTGIAFSMVAAACGLNMIVVMPCNMSDERKKMIKGFGGTIIEVGESDFEGAAELSHEIAQKHGYFEPLQFENLENQACHKETTAQEILSQVPKGMEINALVAGTGTGGTLMGVSEALKEHFPNLVTIAVEPSESAVMLGKEPGMHSIQGIGDGFIPELVKIDAVDEVMTVSSEESIAEAQRLCKQQGLFVGISAGANSICAHRAAEKYGNTITFLCDRGERYLSMMCPNQVDQKTHQMEQPTLASKI